MCKLLYINPLCTSCHGLWHVLNIRGEQTCFFVCEKSLHTSTICSYAACVCVYGEDNFTYLHWLVHVHIIALIYLPSIIQMHMLHKSSQHNGCPHWATLMQVMRRGCNTMTCETGLLFCCLISSGRLEIQPVCGSWWLISLYRLSSLDCKFGHLHNCCPLAVQGPL